jgi:hypothetical protein
MNNPNTVNHSEELFSDKYEEAILKIAKTLTQKPPFVKNTLNDLDMWVGKEPNKKRCTYIYHEIYNKLHVTKFCIMYCMCMQMVYVPR